MGPALAKSHGYVLEDIVGGTKKSGAKKKGETLKTVPVKYRHPENKDIGLDRPGKAAEMGGRLGQPGEDLEGVEGDCLS